MLILNIIGCGRVGKTLGRLWASQGVVRIGDVMNRSLQSTGHAVAFLGQGRSVDSPARMRAADIWLIATCDDNIAATAHRLAACGSIRSGDTVFHCSGAFSSAELLPLSRTGVALASVHPVKSFADPRDAVSSFGGTFCAVEGDIRARDLLTEMFAAIGGETFYVDSSHKLIYHAAAVFACNYLTALLETARRCCLKAGIDEKTAMSFLEPLVRETLANVFQKGPSQALTGPISRGDSRLVAEQMAALLDWQPQTGELYRLLGKVALELAKEKGSLSSDIFQDMEAFLQSRKPE